jgi:hypothetical protein
LGVAELRPESVFTLELGGKNPFIKYGSVEVSFEAIADGRCLVTCVLDRGRTLFRIAIQATLAGGVVWHVPSSVGLAVVAALVGFAVWQWGLAWILVKIEVNKVLH